MKRILVMAVLALGASPAAAQDAARISLLPANPARWDAAVDVGWLGSNQSEIAPDWDDWYDVATAAGGVGYYWTPHLRSELRVAFSGTGRVFEEQLLRRPELPYPVFDLREHRFRATTIGAGLNYQFFDNQCFHPSLGGGLELLHEKQNDAARLRARPFLSAGFKWYVSDRGFTRSDIRVSFDSRGVAQTTWTAGLGVDL